MDAVRRKQIVIAALLFSVALVALGVFLFGLGLDDADKVSSVVGAFSGLVGLALSVFALVWVRTERTDDPPAGATSEVRVKTEVGSHEGEYEGMVVKRPPAGGAQIDFKADKTGPQSRITGYREV